ncbi:hypothetical protein NE237_011919 [Protea cynaroides]|uniref:Uncharacterized protein n=1 Tax=Protea cynaroides TaxID=273540 RepID=A0A9Q0GY47_9MAGN|nr:hypothetical protein NE237_011919 [Protea cynaroides]
MRPAVLRTLLHVASTHGWLCLQGNALWHVLLASMAWCCAALLLDCGITMWLGLCLVACASPHSTELLRHSGKGCPLRTVDSLPNGDDLHVAGMVFSGDMEAIGQSGMGGIASKPPLVSMEELEKTTESCMEKGLPQLVSGVREVASGWPKAQGVGGLALPCMMQRQQLSRFCSSSSLASPLVEPLPSSLPGVLTMTPLSSFFPIQPALSHALNPVPVVLSVAVESSPPISFPASSGFRILDQLLTSHHPLCSSCLVTISSPTPFGALLSERDVYPASKPSTTISLSSPVVDSHSLSYPSSLSIFDSSHAT